MNKLTIIPIVLGIAAVASYSVLLPEDSFEPLATPIYDSGFTYYDIETIQTSLIESFYIIDYIVIYTGIL